jgi:pimeloyl-ACP methyl ester carboxylesterase
MPYMEKNDVKIYYEVEGQGPPLLLHHGLTGSMNSFKTYGYTEALKPKYKLILMDARGHGKSSKLYTPDSYRLKTLVNDVVSLLDTLNVDKTHYLGYSWGGRIGLAVAKYAPDRFNSLIIGGMGAYESDSVESIKRNQARVEAYKDGFEGVIAEREKNGFIIPSERKEQLRSNDFKALAAVRLTQEHIGFTDFLTTADIPCLVYAGEVDYWHSFAEDTAKLIKGAKFVSIPGLNHIEGIQRSELILPHITNFLNKL